MSDLWLELSKNQSFSKTFGKMGIPFPKNLNRSNEGWKRDFLNDKKVMVYGTGDLKSNIVTALNDFSATVLDTRAEREKVHALVYDATGMESDKDLRVVYDFFHKNIKAIADNGRVVILGAIPSEQNSLIKATLAQALEGLMRSMAKEIGRKGATAQLVQVAPNAIERLPGVLQFLLSDKSAFISGQVLKVTSEASSSDLNKFEKILEGKVALVTGAARGIGRETAKTLATEGAQLVCLDLENDRKLLEELSEEIGCRVLTMDITADNAAEEIEKYLMENFGGVDIVVHNAGITRDKTLGNMSEKLWDQALSVNLYAVIKITERLLEKCLKDNGRLICLSSISGIAGNFGQTNYSASKAGLIGFVRHMSKEVANRGITVNGIAPGFIETRLTAAIPLFSRQAGRRLSNLFQGGTPKDIANAITFLSSDGSCGVTGGVLRVCGGSFIGA
ncbi:MAG: 3-oxoacyl-ACP reductase [Bacteriovoracaceae bacterium]